MSVSSEQGITKHNSEVLLTLSLWQTWLHLY